MPVVPVARVTSHHNWLTYSKLSPALTPRNKLSFVKASVPRSKLRYSLPRVVCKLNASNKLKQQKALPKLAEDKARPIKSLFMT